MYQRPSFGRRAVTSTSTAYNKGSEPLTRRNRTGRLHLQDFLTHLEQGSFPSPSPKRESHAYGNRGNCNLHFRCLSRRIAVSPRLCCVLTLHLPFSAILETSDINC